MQGERILVLLLACSLLIVSGLMTESIKKIFFNSLTFSSRARFRICNVPELALLHGPAPARSSRIPDPRVAAKG